MMFLCVWASGSRKQYIGILLGIFFDDQSYHAPIRKLAGENLAMLSSKSKTNAFIIVTTDNCVVPNLTKVLIASYANKAYRINAAQILKNIYRHCSKDIQCLKDLKIVMTDVLPEVLTEIFSCDLRINKNRGSETDTNEPKTSILKLPSVILPFGSNKGEVSQKGRGEEIDIESQKISARDYDQYHDQHSSHQQNYEQADEQQEAPKLQAALLSLSATIFEILITEDEDLAALFGATAARDDSFSFSWKLKEMVESCSGDKADNIRILKSTIKIAIALMKHRSSYINEDMESLIDTLSNASESMEYVDAIMMFSSDDDGDPQQRHRLQAD
ncbi:hypothetical protein EJB05_01217, partial [Eragrostis curvula]